MIAIGLTGGIGSGKSTVSAMLAARGAQIIDADAVYASLIRPGLALHGALVARFGDAFLLEDGTIDRPALAAVVFADRAALADLNALTHPAVGAVIADRLAALAATDAIVILDIPLFVESGRGGVAGVIVVDVPPEIAVSRLVAQRGMDDADVRRRMANQASREERLARADLVIDNSGDRQHLEAEVARAWQWIEGLEAEVTARRYDR